MTGMPCNLSAIASRAPCCLRPSPPLRPPLRMRPTLDGRAARQRRSKQTRAQPDRPEDNSEPAKSIVPDSMPSFSSSEDWRDFRAKLVAGESRVDTGNDSSSSGDSPSGKDDGNMWVHPVSQVETGMLLVANPLMFQSQQEYFAQAVILVFAHDEKGTCGLILNRPTEITVAKVGDGSHSNRLSPELDPCTIHLGGDVGEGTLHLLHRHDLPQTLQVMPGVYLGGIDQAKEGISLSRYSPEEFKVLTRYSGWSPGQLERECKLGVWYMAAASRSFVLQQGSDGKGMWHAALDLMGGDFLSLSTACRDSYDASVMEYEKPEEPPQDP